MGARPEDAPPLTDRRPALHLFLVCLGVYALTAGGHFYAFDDQQKFQALDALMERGTFAYPEGWADGLMGRKYGWFPLGASLIMLPGYLAGHLLAPLAPGLPGDEVARAAIAFQNAAVSAALVALAFLAARAAGFARGAALGAALTLGFGTMVWPYAKTSWSEPTAALLAFAGLMALWRGERAPRGPDAPWLVGAGAALGGALLIRLELAIAAAGALAWLAWRGRADRGALAARLALVGLPLAGAAAVSAWYELLRFGSLTELPNYRGPQARVTMNRGAYALMNAYQYTASPNQGIFWFSPPALLGLLGWRAFHARRPELAALLAVALGPLLAFYVVGWGSSSWAWGQRYAYVFVPFLALPIAAFLATGNRAVAKAVIGAGVLVQLLAVPYDANYLYERELAKTPQATVHVLMHDPRRGPLVLAARDLPMTLGAGARALAAPPKAVPIATALRQARREGVPDAWWLLYWTAPVPRWAIAIAAAGLAALALGAAAALARALRTAPGV